MHGAHHDARPASSSRRRRCTLARAVTTLIGVALVVAGANALQHVPRARRRRAHAPHAQPPAAGGAAGARDRARLRHRSARASRCRCSRSGANPLTGGAGAGVARALRARLHAAEAPLDLGAARRRGAGRDAAAHGLDGVDRAASTRRGWRSSASCSCWQIPHFIAISMFRAEEYARAGLKVVAVVRGRRRRALAHRRLARCCSSRRRCRWSRPASAARSTTARRSRSARCCWRCAALRPARRWRASRRSLGALVLPLLARVSAGPVRGAGARTLSTAATRGSLRLEGLTRRFGERVGRRRAHARRRARRGVRLSRPQRRRQVDDVHLLTGLLARRRRPRAARRARGAAHRRARAAAARRGVPGAERSTTS